ncbi:peptidylprolyl isomerase SurA [Thalassotalea sp. 1_MG-2023]|uniref:peptidylprolyl isomerase SurA n=1 Tax=Thalassotalea sp. 1_MG-2023 TaxID=3062680 RepID=UPI0026E1DCD2|nr:peptidylprolyl isomerase SurA [Thalassotalea sp. 1_MG-2023]MDO6427084.1 peptidylprolyl isomerase SurA [Thalassotalea sp. 1_MG-2023]
MKTIFKSFVLACAFIGSYASAQEVKLDSVAVIVNDGVVLESEIQDFLSKIKQQAAKKNQTLPSDKALRVQVTEKLIDDNLVAQLGERMGIQISDAQLDETILSIAQDNNLTLEQFRQSIISEGLDYEKYRENARQELISGEVTRNSVRRRIYISPQEVTNLLAVMKEQTNNDVEYRLGHILIEFPPEPSQDDINAAKTRAEKVLKLLNDGSDFTRIAIASSGGSNALEGGDLGWRSINELPTLFSELVDGKDKDTILGPIRTGLGFSIVKIQDIRGRQVMEVEEVNSRHILIEPTIILSEAKAKETLENLREQIVSGEADFAELAKEYSDGPTSVKGGELGWTDPKSFDPAFSNTLAKLKVNEVSQPFRTSFGWHIAELTGRRTLDATQQMNENRVYQVLYKRKYSMESARWLKEMRDEAYIEILE